MIRRFIKKIRDTVINVLCILCCISAGSVALAQEKGIPVIVDGDQVRYLHDEGKVVAQGNVRMKYEDVTIYCDEAVYNTETHNAFIHGEVKVVSPKGVIYGKDAVYDFYRKQTKIDDIRMESPPTYGEAPEAFGESEDKYVIQSGYVTTCDYDRPHYRLRTKRIILYPKEKIVAKNVVFMLGNVPVFYLPSFTHSLKDKSYPFELSPGSSGEWGMYLLTRYRYNMNEENRGKIHLDFYERRGFGQGITHKLETKDWGEALFNAYHIEDSLYARDKRNELFDEYPERSTLSDKLLEDDRYRTEFSYDWQAENGLSIKAEFHKLSDKYIVKDFFYREYEIDSAPDTYALASYSFPHSAVSLLARKRVNRFWTEVQYLPELEYTLFKHTLTEGLPLYFNSDFSVADISRKYANSPRSEDVKRIHTKNVLSYDSRIAWLTINPHADFYSTYYSENKFDNKDIIRNAFGAGVSLSTRLYKVADKAFVLFGQHIEKMRHIVTPIINYGYIHDPTVSNSNLIQFDSKDALSRNETVKFTLENKVQVKSEATEEETGEQRIWDMIYFSPSISYRINSPNGGSAFTIAEVDFEFYPIPEFSLTADARYDCVSGNFQEIDTDLRLTGGEAHPYSVALGHRYARKENSQTTLSWNYQFNPTLEFRNYIRYEFKSQEFKEQQYIFTKDLHCWLMDVGVNVDRDQNYTLWFMFRVKDFPQVRFGFDHTYHGGRQSY
ncbi:MAG: LPS-assembly protein LptD [Candidatus Omnitrophica bacterium]|nr:LPS-assembly protein LptD [Candidatus Omnitrophota bacterium]